ncbi:MAG: hypothetical protein U9P81_11240, partial [Euryarchaeota archaeon]|nr:hypothetical protein [Euryarchaeota archaeon]
VIEYRTNGSTEKYIPPDPVSLRNTTGNFWVNYTWQAGAGNVTDSYNICINGTWTNGTTLTYSNDTVGPHGTSTIIVYAYNNSAVGTLSSGSLTDSVTIPNNPIIITNTGNTNVNKGETVDVDYDFIDADNDPATFSCNRTDLFTDFNIDTGIGTWLTESNGTYFVDFGVSDGQGSTDNYTMTISVNGNGDGTITSRISQGSDDAEEHVHNGYIDYVSSDLELVLDRYTQTIGLRFQNIQVPNGATITNAYVEFETDETGSTSTYLTFYGEDVDNSVTFIPGYSYNVSSRTKTSASVTWLNVPAWDTVGEKHQTPDISPIIQEIVNRNNWASGNALSIIVTGSGRRTAESYNGEPDNAPLLVIEYGTGEPQAKYIPPDPVSLRNTTGNFWVNYTWQAGAGNVTDSYNIRINGTWTNGTTLTYSNDTVGPHGTSTIIVYAYNTSANGTLSSGSLTDSVTIPNNPITITNTNDASVKKGVT